MKNFQRTVLTTLLALFLSVTAMAVPTDEAEAAADIVHSVLTLVRAEFIEDVPPGKLFNGALAGVEKALDEKKIEYPSLERIPEDANREDAQKKFDEQFLEVAKKNPKLVEENWLAYEAIQGMLKDLGDDYTVFMDPEEYRRLRESMSGGNFGGVGIYIQLDKERDNRLMVVEPIPDTPAAEAGLKAGDLILKVDGVTTLGVDVNGAQDMLRGEVGSKVTLTIQRKNQAQPFDVVLERAKIHVSSVQRKMIKKDGHRIGYVRLRVFGSKSDEEMEEALRYLEDRGAEAFILDLRNNGGGYIVAAVDICSRFLETGSTVVSVRERQGGNSVYQSHPNLRDPRPLAVLVNEYSASASEITAAALQDLKRATLIGVKTFGKGSVQKIFPRPDGSALKVTTAHYHTPTDKAINKVGVTPDTVLEFKGKSLAGTDDNQLIKAADILTKELGQKPSKVVRMDGSGAVRVSSVSEELDYLRSLGPGPSVVDRRFVETENQLVEELRVRYQDGSEKTVRFDLSEFVGL